MTQSSRVCSYCGFPITAEARFCEKCGRPVGVTTRQPNPSLQGGASRKGTVWWVCGSLAVVGVVAALCVGGAGLLFWTETIPLPEFLNSKPEPVVQVIPTLVIETPQPSIPATESAVPPEVSQTEAAEPASPPPDFQFEGVSLSFDESLMRDLKGSRVPAPTGNGELPPWEMLPSYINLDLVGYTIQDHFHEPRIMIFPLDEYYTVSESSRETAGSLQKLLADKNIQPDQSIPFLPEWNAAQVFHAAEKFIDFKNGSGVRFLTQYGQDISPINNNAIFYCFQGLTSDGKYYVSAVFPVFDPLLPMDGSEIPNGDYEAFSASYPDIIRKTAAELNEQQDMIFLPELKLLDEMMASIEIKP